MQSNISDGVLELIVTGSKYLFCMHIVSGTVLSTDEINIHPLTNTLKEQ